MDPLFQDDDGDASQMEESSDGLTGETGLSGAYDPNAPDQPEVDFFGRLDPTVETVFYDSVCGIPLFIAPRGRSFDDFRQESLKQ